MTAVAADNDDGERQLHTAYTCKVDGKDRWTDIAC